MAPSSRPGASPLAPTDALPKPQPSNGVLTTSNTPSGTINRKKAKRRQKQAAKQIASRDEQSADYADDDEYQNPDLSNMHNPPPADLRYADPYPPGSMPPGSQYDYDNDADLVYSDEDGPYAYDNAPRAAPAAGTLKKSKKKKKKKTRTLQNGQPLSAGMPGHYPSPLPQAPPGQIPRQATISEEALRTVQRRATKDAIWDTSSQEERIRIKEFWLNLEEEKRKSLVKIEKEAVLRKMKEQQKHSCSCTVCGRKRTAIEEELEVLYDAYYEELEQFANHGQPIPENGIASMQPAGNGFHHSMSRGPPDRSHDTNPSSGRIEEVTDDDEEELEEENDDDLSDVSYDDDYTSTGTDEVPPENTPASDFFSFGKSLTVKGGILTVADDLLKNDGQKFIDMMEQLAERRMQREEDAALGPYRVPQHQPMAQQHGQHSHPQPPPEEDEYSDEEDDEDYDSQADELEEEDDEMDTMTEEQRMEEGRRMFQIFAARMFEQRVLTAYREKVARDRQDMLIAEVEGEKDNDKEREAKKQKDALKKKQKKAQQKAAKDQKAQQKAEAEAKAKADDEARLAEQKRKREEQREEQRRKKEEERKKVEEDKAKKEAEKQRRQQQERERQQEQERKAREVKAEEKRRKEEAKQKEREAREAKEKEVREKREQAEHDKRMKEEQARREASAQDAAATSQPDLSRRPPPPAKVALPPGLLSTSSISSPQVKLASPVLPHAPAPVRPRDVPAAGSEASSKQSNPPKATSFPQNSQPIPHASRTAAQPGPQAYAATAPLQPIAPPPGMSHPSNPSMPGFSPVPMSPYSGQGPMLANSNTRAFSGQQQPQPQPQQHGMYGPGGPHMAHRPGFGMPQHGGMPSGMNAPMQAPQHVRSFPDASPASYVPHNAAAAPGFGLPQHNAPMPTHSRQASGSSPIGPPGAAQPIGRPNMGAIKRPASVKPGNGADIDDLSTHLGSSALLDDDDGPDPLTVRDNNQRPSGGLSMPLVRAGFVEAPGRPGLVSPFEHGAAGFGGLGQRLPPSDNTWAPRAGSGQFGGAHPMGGPGGWGSAAAPGAGWGSAAVGNGPLARGSTQRPMTIRKLACEACRNLAMSKGGVHGGYSEIAEVLHQMQQARADLGIQRRELEEILDTEDPDEHNGGGHFVRMGSRVTHVTGRGVRAGSGLGLGEIGSPLPGLSAPNLPNLGRY